MSSNDEVEMPHLSILDRIEEERVFKIKRVDNTLELREDCDGFFAIRLSKSEMYQLLDELKYLANNLKD